MIEMDRIESKCLMTEELLLRSWQKLHTFSNLYAQPLV